MLRVCLRKSEYLRMIAFIDSKSNNEEEFVCLSSKAGQTFWFSAIKIYINN